MGSDNDVQAQKATRDMPVVVVSWFRLMNLDQHISRGHVVLAKYLRLYRSWDTGGNIRSPHFEPRCSIRGKFAQGMAGAWDVIAFDKTMQS